MKIRDTPGFPPIWQTASFSQKTGLIGTLRYIKFDREKKRIIIAIEENGELLIGHYQADPNRLNQLNAVLEKHLGKPLAAVAELEIN